MTRPSRSKTRRSAWTTGPIPKAKRIVPEADRSAEQEADHQDDQLDRRPGAPDRPAEAMVEARHQAVARTRAEVGREVEAGAQADDQHPADAHRQLGDRLGGAGEQRQHQVGRDPDEDDVQERADAGTLPEGPPQGQDRDPHEDAHGAEREPVRFAIPWWNASHGPRPRPDAAMTAIPTPNGIRPAIDPGRRRSTVRPNQRSRIARWYRRAWHPDRVAGHMARRRARAVARAADDAGGSLGAGGRVLGPCRGVDAAGRRTPGDGLSLAAPGDRPGRRVRGGRADLRRDAGPDGVGLRRGRDPRRHDRPRPRGGGLLDRERPRSTAAAPRATASARTAARRTTRWASSSARSSMASPSRS